MVVETFGKYYSDKKLPTRLEVVDVTWTDKGVVCELWYKKIDVDKANLNGTKLFTT